MLVLEVIDSLNGNGKLGLSQSVIREMVTSQGCSQWTGLGVFLANSGKQLEISSLGWGIGFQSMLVAYPFLGTGAVIMTNTDLGVHQSKGIIGEMMKSLALD